MPMKRNQRGINKMKRCIDFLAAWIIVQFVVIGFLLGESVVEMENHTYDCSNKPLRSEVKFVIISTLMPLVYFIPDSSKIKSYCKKEKAGEKVIEESQ